MIQAGIRAKLDDTDKSPGWKFSEQEMRGIPVRIEMGPKDLEAGQAVVVRRDNRRKDSGSDPGDCGESPGDSEYDAEGYAGAGPESIETAIRTQPVTQRGIQKDSGREAGIYQGYVVRMPGVRGSGKRRNRSHHKMHAL